MALTGLTHLFCLLIGSVAASYGLYQVFRIARILSNRGTALGTVVQTRFALVTAFRLRTSESGREGFVTVRFETPDRQTIQYEQQAPGPLPLRSHTAQSLAGLNGTQLKVHYDRSNPGRATLSPLKDAVYGAICTGFGLAVFAALALYWDEFGGPAP